MGWEKRKKLQFELQIKVAKCVHIFCKYRKSFIVFQKHLFFLFLICTFAEIFERLYYGYCIEVHAGWHTGF